MPISVQCIQCGKNLKVPDTMAGKRGKCPCGNVVTIPMNGAIQQTPTAPAPQGFENYSPAGPGKGSGTVTAPDTFKKLYLAFLLTTIAGFVLFLITATLGIMAFTSQASQTFGDIGAQIEHDNKVRQWEMNGRRGPMPPPPPAPKTSTGSTALRIVSALLDVIRLVLGIGGLVCYCIFLYKAWDLIQDGQVQTTPGKAVGFMFIPFFNFYWYFIAVKGLADDLNQYSQQRNISARPASAGMMIAAFVLMVTCLCYPVGLVLYLIGLNGIKNACMDIAQAKLA